MQERRLDPLFQAKDREYAKKKREELPEKVKLAKDKYRSNPLHREMEKFARQAWGRANKDKVSNYRYKARYGITIKDKRDMWVEQEGKCLICGKVMFDLSQAHVDHDHDSKKVRGLLCLSCNRGIGFLQDSSKVVESALRYLLQNGN